MNVIDIMKRPAAYASGYENIPGEEQNRAKQLCWEYNRTAPKERLRVNSRSGARSCRSFWEPVIR